jgi:hypothetical protein
MCLRVLSKGPLKQPSNFRPSVCLSDSPTVCAYLQTPEPTDEFPWSVAFDNFTKHRPALATFICIDNFNNTWHKHQREA